MASPKFSFRLLAIALSFMSTTTIALAQSTSTYPQSWTPTAICSSGLPTPTVQNGSFSDAYSAVWNVQCGQDSTGIVYDGTEGTNGQGVTACFRGCDKRPGCTAFSFIETAGTTESKRIFPPSPHAIWLTCFNSFHYWVWEMLLQICDWNVLHEHHRLCCWNLDPWITSASCGL